MSRHERRARAAIGRRFRMGYIDPRFDENEGCVYARIVGGKVEASFRNVDVDILEAQQEALERIYLRMRELGVESAVFAWPFA